MRSFALMQPHFAPYIGYFYLIFSVDTFVFYDTAQFSHQSWQCRNRVLDQNGRLNMLSVPVSRASKFQPISKVQLSRGKAIDIQNSLEDLVNRIEVYYRRAPHASALQEFLGLAFRKPRPTMLMELNIRTIKAVYSQLSSRVGRSPEFRLFSATMENVPEFMSLERVTRIAKCAASLGCQQYFTPVGSVDYMLKSSNIDQLDNLITCVLSGNRVTYKQHDGKGRILPDFQENLSVLDLIANVGWDGAAEILLNPSNFEIRDITSFQEID